MATDAPMPTPIETLTLAQWFSPNFPVGAFAYSHGLETAIDRRDVSNMDDVHAWISAVLHHGAGWNDCLFIAAAYDAQTPAEVAALDAQNRALQASSERLKESDLQGQAFCKAIDALHGLDLGRLTYPVAIGRAAAHVSLPLPQTAQFYLQSVMSNLVAIAMRLVPLGQTEGQTLISRMTPACVTIADQATDSTLDGLSASAFLADIAAMQHETQYSRICRT